MKQKNNVLGTVLFIILTPVFIIAFSNFIVGWDGFYGKNLRVPFDGDTSRSCVIDDRDILSDAEEKELNELIRKSSAELEMNIIIFVSGTKHSDAATADFAANTYDQLMGKEYFDGVLYYMDFSGKRPAYDYLDCTGKAAVIYGENPSAITDAVVPYLPPSSKQDITSADVIPGIEQFLKVLSRYNSNYSYSRLFYTKDAQNGIYFYDNGTEFCATKKMAPGKRLIMFLISGFLGYIIMILIYFITKSKYKFKDKTNPNIYVSKGETTYSENSDVFIRTYTTKTKIESSSGGGGHHGGGGHSGGHVGGGSHR